MKTLLIGILSLLSVSAFADTNVECPDLSGTYKSAPGETAFFPALGFEHPEGETVRMILLEPDDRLVIEQTGCEHLLFRQFSNTSRDYPESYELPLVPKAELKHKVILKKKSISYYGAMSEWKSGTLPEMGAAFLSFPARDKYKMTQKKNGDLRIRYRNGISMIGVVWFVIPVMHPFPGVDHANLIKIEANPGMLK